jgi:hypothetical protein
MVFQLCPGIVGIAISLGVGVITGPLIASYIRFYTCGGYSTTSNLINPFGNSVDVSCPDPGVGGISSTFGGFAGPLLPEICQHIWGENRSLPALGVIAKCYLHALKNGSPSG